MVEFVAKMDGCLSTISRNSVRSNSELGRDGAVPSGSHDGFEKIQAEANLVRLLRVCSFSAAFW